MKSRPLIALVCFLIMSPPLLAQSEIDLDEVVRVSFHQMDIIAEDCVERYDGYNSRYRNCVKGANFIASNRKFAWPEQFGIDLKARVGLACQRSFWHGLAAA